jgi:hypothetical protein
MPRIPFVRRLLLPLSPAAGDRWAAIGLVALVAALCYGLLLPWLGFYRDDWYQIWAGTTLGPGSIVTLFSIDRPVMGYTYAATFFALRDSALAWQIYALTLRLLGAIGALWLFRRLWPGRPFLTTSAALLFLVYPGFLQQPNANTFSNHLLGYTAEVLSLAATVELLEMPRGRRRTGLTVFAVGGGLTCWLLYEYMIGLEFLRYFLIARSTLRAAGRPDRQWLRRILSAAAPFLIPLLGFLFWRVFIFRPTRMSVDVAQALGAYSSSPVGTLLQRAAEIGRDFIESSLLAWIVPTYERISQLAPAMIALALIPAAAAVLAYAGYLRYRRHVESQIPPETPVRLGPGREMILLGTLTTLASLAPVVLAGRDVRWSSAFDRYTLHATLGLAMLTIGLVVSVIRPGGRPAVLAALLGLAVLSHQANAVHWARFWEEQRQLWWQLTWRAPGLEPGTVLMVNLPSQRYFEDYEIWGPANLIYAPGDRSPDLAAQVIAEDTADAVRLGSKDVRSMRVLIGIPRDFRNTLIVDWPSPGACVHVLGGSQPEDAFTSGRLVQSIAEYSRDDRVQLDAVAARPPQRLFGSEPDRAWCWYYQAAALARQQRDWPHVVEVAEQAGRLDLTPSDLSEWMPFFQGYVNVGDVEQARRVAGMIRQDGSLAEHICLRLNEHAFSDRASYRLGRSLLCSEAAREAGDSTSAVSSSSDLE